MFSFLLLLTGFFTAVNAQITVTGTVTSAEDGEPIPGVSVAVRGTTIGTVTNIDGHYSIEVPSEESVLRFSFVGMIRRDIMVGNQRAIDVVLDPDVVGLDEVVVTGYGVQRRRDLTGSVASVRSQDIEGMPVTSLDRAIQGRAAGVQVTAGDGVPGGHVSVIIRGIGSFSSNAPLYIVDGVEVHTGSLGGRSESENLLSAIDFNDIESIDILKDAAASAIYGARGAGGVVIITTKRGEASEKTDFTFDIHRGYSEVIQFNPVMNGPQWAQWYSELFANYFGTDAPQYWNMVQLGLNRNWWQTGADGHPDFSTTPNYDWQDAVYRTGNVWDARLTARGGDERTRFYSSMSHNLTEGHIRNYDFSRSSFRLNLDHDPTDRLRFDIQINANITDQNTTRMGGAFSSPIMGSAGMPPVERIFDDEGNYFGAPRSVFGSMPIHVVNSLDYDHLISRNVKTIVNIGSSYDFTDHITYRAAFGIDYNHNDEEQWYDPRAGDGYPYNGVLYDYETTAYAVQTTQTLNYSNVFADVHELSGVAGFETWERVWKTTRVGGENFPNPHMNVMSAAASVWYWSGNETVRKHAGAFGRLNYAYDGKYMMTLTGRYDGSSRFGARNRWGFFPAVALGWRISSEPFMAGFDRIDNLMLRLSYGTSGSDAAGTYAALGLWSGGTQYMGATGIYPTQLPNEYLTWEESRTLNMAISMTTFNGRLNMDLDLFNRWSERLLLNRPLPGSTGWTSITENVGKTINEGIEISINTVNVQTDNFRWNTGFNISFIENEILELLPGQDFFSDRRMVGRAIDDWNVNMWAGVNPADGRPMYYDKDWNITYQPTYSDRHWMGPVQPTSFGGITNEFTLGNFGASFFFQYSGGSYRYFNDLRYFFSWPAVANQNLRTFVNRWQEPGQLADAPQPMFANRYAGSVRPPDSYASHMIERVDYIRLKDVSIQYSVPSNLTRRFRVENLRLFARGANLLTWTDYSGTDPEFTGSDWGTYPQGKTVTFGISTNF